MLLLLPSSFLSQSLVRSLFVGTVETRGIIIKAKHSRTSRSTKKSHNSQTKWPTTLLQTIATLPEKAESETDLCVQNKVFCHRE